MQATLNQCSDCTAFKPSSQIPHVGGCEADGDRVLAKDPSCTTFKGHRGRTMVRIGSMTVGID